MTADGHFQRPGGFPISFLAVAAGLGFLGGVVGAAVVRERGGAAAFPRGEAPPGALERGVPRMGQPGVSGSVVADPVADVVERASPAVVSVVVTKDLPKLEDVVLEPLDGSLFGPSPFRFRLRRPSGETEPREIGGGTGFVVDPSGWVLTNRHVVSATDADYTVVFSTGEKVPARVLARDPALDLAVLKVDKVTLPTIKLGDSGSLRVGQTVIAIGNALGEFRNTVSVGVISGLGRQIVAGEEFRGESEVLDAVIQTDAAINLGNSGGPLLNLRGEAVGVNTAVARGAENIGFALPSSEAARILSDIRTHGRITRPFLGIRYVMVNVALKKARRLPVDYGALVLSGERREDLAVVPGSAADRAGIKEGDLILEIDGQRIDAQHMLAALVRQKSVGDRARLKVLSQGEEKVLEVTLGEAK